MDSSVPVQSSRSMYLMVVGGVSGRRGSVSLGVRVQHPGQQAALSTEPNCTQEAARHTCLSGSTATQEVSAHRKVKSATHSLPDPKADQSQARPVASRVGAATTCLKKSMRASPPGRG